RRRNLPLGRIHHHSKAVISSTRRIHRASSSCLVDLNHHSLPLITALCIWYSPAIRPHMHGHPALLLQIAHHLAIEGLHLARRTLVIELRVHIRVLHTTVIPFCFFVLT